MRTYGIFVSYSPAVDLRKDGLGRVLGEFLDAARGRDDVRFVVACPSWHRENMQRLFDDIGAEPGRFELLAPRRLPLLLRLRQALLGWLKRARSGGRLRRLAAWAWTAAEDVKRSIERTLVSTRSIVVIAAAGLLYVPFLAAALAIRLFGALLRGGSSLIRGLGPRRWRRVGGPRPSSLTDALERPRRTTLATRLYWLMEEAETRLIVEAINARTDIDAWYCPAAFWPGFNQIKGPRLMTVPDAVPKDFPVGFSLKEGRGALALFQKVEASIKGGSYFAAYSVDVKQRTLVDHYHVPPAAVDVVPHGAMRLDEWVTVTGFPDNEQAALSHCRNLFASALSKSADRLQASLFAGSRPRFLFYPSQFRPNKNVLTLLRAYEHLLRSRHIGAKLILTGDPELQPAVGRFIEERQLGLDVLCLKGLSIQELAACYRLAELAVNPSLSEGGCPFTLTEALSVGTPVVLARIPVTQEVINDPDLDNAMLFDPHDWKDMADRIEWALRHREKLLSWERLLYERLKQRTWRHVVDDYVGILDRLSAHAG